MNDFQLWFFVGTGHLLDPGGFDHILYIALLTLSFPAAEWKKLVILITGFTIGHSIALAAAVTTNIHFPQAVVELLIALSILLTGIFQLFRNVNGNTNKIRSNKILYGSTVVFGLIHGLGFSFLLRSMLGEAGNVFLPLLYFNLGLEAAQLIIVGLIILFSILLSQVFKWRRQPIKIIFLCLLILVAAAISVQRLLPLL